MSAGTGAGGKLSVYVLFSIDVKTKKEEIAAFRKEVREMAQAIDPAAKVTSRFTREMKQQAVSVRSTLLDLRMFSFAVRTLRRELGSTSPIVESVSSGLLVFSAVATGAVAGMDLMKKGAIILGANMTALKSTLSGVVLVLAKFPALIAGIAIVAASLTGYFVGTWIGERVSGITAIKKAIEEWKEEVEALQSSLRDMSLEMGAVNEKAQYYALQISVLERAIEKQGYTTEDQARKLYMLNQAYSDAKLNIQAMGYEALVTQNRMANLNAEQERGEERMKDIRHRAFHIPTAEEWVGMNTPGGGAGGAQINISIPNAVFQNIGDVVGAMQQAGAAAGDAFLERQRQGVRMRRP